MKRLCEARAYGKKPIAACYWASTTDTPELATLTQDISTEIAIIGAGFTGLSAAHHLAKRGADITVIEAEFPAFGATGRNGGFCCLGGARAENVQLDRRYGKAQRLAYRRSEAAAVGLVKTLLDQFDLQVDTHSSGETLLAHRASDSDRLKNSRAQIKEDYGVEALFHSKSELRQLGMQGPFHGALTIPIGFGLNPRKYAYGLLSSSVKNGSKVFANSPAINLKKISATFRLTTPQGSITADRVIIATNAYAAEDLPAFALFSPDAKPAIFIRNARRSVLNRPFRGCDTKADYARFSRDVSSLEKRQNSTFLDGDGLHNAASNSLYRGHSQPQRGLCRVWLSWQWRGDGQLCRGGAQRFGDRRRSGFRASKTAGNAAA